jgi:hypothetical protein
VKRRGQDTSGADTDIFIPLEEFTTAATRTGGLVGVLSPSFEAILQIPRTGGAVIVDWPGFAASACASEIAVWWQKTGAELLKMLEVKHTDASVPA